MKKYRTNSKHVRNLVKQYMLECMYDYDENEFDNFEAAAEHLKSEFIRVSNHKYNVLRFPNHQDRFQDYLSSAVFRFPIYTYEKEEFLNSLGINPEGKKYKTEKLERLFSYLIFRELKY